MQKKKPKIVVPKLPKTHCRRCGKPTHGVAYPGPCPRCPPGLANYQPVTAEMVVADPRYDSLLNLYARFLRSPQVHDDGPRLRFRLPSLQAWFNQHGFVVGSVVRWDYLLAFTFLHSDQQEDGRFFVIKEKLPEVPAPYRGWDLDRLL